MKILQTDNYIRKIAAIVIDPETGQRQNLLRPMKDPVIEVRYAAAHLEAERYVEEQGIVSMDGKPWLTSII